MKSVDENRVFRQFLKLLPANALACPIINYNAKKLTNLALVKLLIMGELSKWRTLRQLSKNVRPNKAVQREIDLKSISHSQISRRLIELNTAGLADILGQLARQYWILHRHAEGINPHVGILRIIDATYVKLPQSAANWTAISKDSSGIKLHIRLAVVSADSAFPEKMIPSTGNVADVDAVNHLIETGTVLYVMDRGYGYKPKMGGWMERGIDFLVRVRSDFSKETIRSYTPTLPNVLKDELVSIRTREEILRYIEFTDEKGNHYHLITTRRNLSAKDIIETYRNRWYIELFFKWIKQHLKVDHLRSQSPAGIWNQLFVTLITYALVEIFRLKQAPGKSAWEFLMEVQVYFFYSMSRLIADLNRRLRKSKGRQKVPLAKAKEIRYGEDNAIVSPISKDHFLSKNQ